MRGIVHFRLRKFLDGGIKKHSIDAWYGSISFIDSWLSKQTAFGVRCATLHFIQQKLTECVVAHFQMIF